MPLDSAHAHAHVGFCITHAFPRSSKVITMSLPDIYLVPTCTWCPFRIFYRNEYLIMLNVLSTKSCPKTRYLTRRSRVFGQDVLDTSTKSLHD